MICTPKVRQIFGCAYFYERKEKNEQKTRPKACFFVGELDEKLTEPAEKPEWFRRFICFSVEKNSEKIVDSSVCGNGNKLKNNSVLRDRLAYLRKI